MDTRVTQDFRQRNRPQPQPQQQQPNGRLQAKPKPAVHQLTSSRSDGTVCGIQRENNEPQDTLGFPRQSRRFVVKNVQISG
jgi:hypothetical protein